MYALLAILLFLSLTIIAYVWLNLGIGLAIAFPLVLGALAWSVMHDPLQVTSGNDRHFFIVIFSIVLVLVEFALLLGGLLNVFTGN